MRPTRKSQPGFAGCPLGQPVFLAEGPARGILVVEGTRCGAQNSHLRVVPTAGRCARWFPCSRSLFPSSHALEESLPRHPADTPSSGSPRMRAKTFCFAACWRRLGDSPDASLAREAFPSSRGDERLPHRWFPYARGLFAVHMSWRVGCSRWLCYPAVTLQGMLEIHGFAVYRRLGDAPDASLVREALFAIYMPWKHRCARLMCRQEVHRECMLEFPVSRYAGGGWTMQ